MKTNEQILKEYYEDKISIHSEFDMYADMLRKALFVANEKLNDGDERCVVGLSIDCVACSNGIFITSYVDDVDDAKQNRPLTMFFRQQTGLDSIQISVDIAAKKTIIFTPNCKRSDFWTSLCGVLPSLIPWSLSFEDKNENDVKYVKTYLTKLFVGDPDSLSEANRMFCEVFRTSYAIKKIMRDKLDEFAQSFLQVEQDRLIERMESLKRQQEDLINTFEHLNSQMQEAKMAKMGLEANNGNHAKVVKDIMSVVNTTDNLSIIDISDSSIYFEYITPMEIWSSEESEVFINNKSSYLYTALISEYPGKGTPSYEIIERFWRGVFETREYKVRFITMFKLDFYHNKLKNAARAHKEDSLERANSQNCIFNPHISIDMTCMSEYAMQVAQCIAEGLYDDAVGSMCMAAKSFSISDIIIGYRLIHLCLNSKCIQTPNGIMSGKEIIDGLMKEAAIETEE